MAHIYLPVQAQRVPLSPVYPHEQYHRVPVSQSTPIQRVHKEVITPKPSSATPPFRNKTTPKTQKKTKNVTPSSDIQQRLFSARML